jgi:putative transposase
MPTFTVLPRRWGGRTFFRLAGRYRRMSKDYEYLTASSEALIYAAMSCLAAPPLTQHAVSER